MSVMDFLFDGQPPAPTTTYGATSTELPRWYSEYTQGVLGRAAALGNEPYQAYGGPRIAGLTPDQQAAIDRTRSTAGQYQPLINQASGLTQAAAGAQFPDQAGRYMSPYITNVTDRAAQLTQRALNEQLLPGLERVFGGAGQDARSSAYRRMADRGVRDLSEGLQAQNLAALDQGYGRAGEMFGEDQRRALTGAGQLSGLAQTGQAMNLRDAAALEAAGRTQQDQTQRSLDLAYQDFSNQRDYPRQQIDWMNAIGRGQNTGQMNATTDVGPAEIYGPSPLAQIASIASGVGALIKKDDPRVQKRGGRIFKYRGGALRYV